MCPIDYYGGGNIFAVMGYEVVIFAQLSGQAPFCTLIIAKWWLSTGGNVSIFHYHSRILGCLVHIVIRDYHNGLCLVIL